MTDEVITKTADEAVQAISGDFAALLGAPSSNPEPKTALEKAVAIVTPEEATVTKLAEAKFSFRSLLTTDQRSQLVASAPSAADKMLKDYNAILEFGAPTREKLNTMSENMLNAQRNIKVPEAEVIVNELLRNIDGFDAKYRNAKIDDFASKMKNFFRGAAYTFKAMERESRPIVEKIKLAEQALKEMELKLADNVVRGQELHRNTNEILDEVSLVLAALEQIQEVARAEFQLADEALTKAQAAVDSEGNSGVEYKGKIVTLNEIKETHATIAGSINELEKTWADWRSLFFIGSAQAPSVRNLILVSSTMQRRCQSFRTMGIPAARSSLVMWQQAVLAKEGAELGDAVSAGTNKLIQGAFEQTADVVEAVAKASQTPLISEETIFVVIDSIKKQCEGLVAADKWGREVRAKNQAALEAGEKQMDKDFTDSRRALVAATMAATSEAAIPAAPLPEADVLAKLGVK